MFFKLRFEPINRTTFLLRLFTRDSVCQSDHTGIYEFTSTDAFCMPVGKFIDSEVTIQGDVSGVLPT